MHQRKGCVCVAVREGGGITEEITERVVCWTSNPHYHFSLFVSPLPLVVTFFGPVCRLEWQLGALWSVCWQSGLAEGDKERRPHTCRHTRTHWCTLSMLKRRTWRIHIQNPKAVPVSFHRCFCNFCNLYVDTHGHRHCWHFLKTFSVSCCANSSCCQPVTNSEWQVNIKTLICC